MKGMKVMTLNQDKFYFSLLAGAKSVLKHKDTLNKINVFPVADGDTGTNLASLMNAILDESSADTSDKNKLLIVADRALEGARGNSGIIFAQYLNGLINELDTSKEDIDFESLLGAIDKAVPYAYDAVSEPVEGTMLTLMREWSETLALLKEKTQDITILLAESFDTLRHLLAETTEKLDVLKQNNVVDAGAKGFFHFVEGFMHYLRDGIMDEMYEDSFDANNSDNEGPENHEAFEEGDYRYCTEALITGENLSAKAIKKTLHDLGNSMVVAGNESKVRVHIHTNEPDKVFFRLRDFGHIKQQKVDDMKRQHEVRNARKYDTVIVTDSIADLPQTMVDRYQIQQIPLILTIEGSDYYDKLTITSDKFYQFMDELKDYPKSAQPNLKQMQNFFSYLSTYYKKIIVISVSSKMSGTHNVFKQAAKTLDDSVQIEVIDSKQNSGAQGLLVMRAAEMVDEGSKFKDIVQTLNTLRDKACILVSVKTLKYMVRGGRVSKATGVIGKITNLKPVISIDNTGEGIIFAKGFSVKMSTNKIFKHLEKVNQEHGIERYAIVHAKADARVTEYIAKAKAITGMDPIYTMDISTIVAMNAGIGTVAIAYITK